MPNDWVDDEFIQLQNNIRLPLPENPQRPVHPPGENIRELVINNLANLANEKKSPKNSVKNPPMERQVIDIWTLPDPEGPYKPEEFLKVNSHLVPKHQYIFTEPRQLIGIEVEIENILRVDPNIEICFWKIKTDGSLRNNGREFITYATPVKYIETALLQLFEGINENVDFSERTSVHIHLDVRKCTISQLYRLIYTYSVVENLLFKYAHIGRRKSIYCVPITETKLLEALTPDGAVFGKYIQNHWNKYSAMNILPLQTQGTLEFRQMPGINNVEKLLIWVDMLIKLKIFAYKYSLENILDMITQLNTNSQYYKFIELVFGPLISYLDTSNLLSDMEKPVFVVKNLAINNKFDKYVLTNYKENSQLYLKFNPELNLSEEQKFLLKKLKAVGGGHYSLMNDKTLIETILQHRNTWKNAFPELIKEFDKVDWPV